MINMILNDMLSGYYSIFRSTIGPTHHWSDTSLIRRPIGPKPHWSDTVKEDYKVITCPPLVLPNVKLLL